MPKKNVIAVLVAVSALLACNVSLFGQTSQGAPTAQPNSAADKDIEMLRQDLRSQRKQIVAQNMDLTADEATKFWPIFDQYRKEAIKPNDDRWALIKEYAANYKTMTDAQANEFMKRATTVDQQLLDLRLKYVPVFEKAVSPQKTALWYQIDRHIDLLINLQLAGIIPVADTGK